LHHEVGATQEELAKMEKYKAWEVVPRLSNMRVMVARWVYCETGKPSACKARSVPKGFSQIEGSTLMSSLHSTIFNLECDIKAAFLNNDLESTIYLAPPEGSHFPRKAINSLFQHSIDEWLLQSLLQLGQIPASTPGDKAAHSSCCLCMWTIKSSLVPADLHLIPSSRLQQ